MQFEIRRVNESLDEIKNSDALSKFCFHLRFWETLFQFFFPLPRFHLGFFKLHLHGRFANAILMKNATLTQLTLTKNANIGLMLRV